MGILERLVGPRQPEMRVNVGHDKQIGRVRIQFDRKLRWFELSPEEALFLAENITKHATAAASERVNIITGRRE